MIVYPTTHEGGELVLRHQDREWKFDAKSLTLSKNSPSLAYVAFYSDVEYEVLEVTSGHRVTVIYHLYSFNQECKPDTWAVTPDSKSVSNLKTTFGDLLESPEFLPYGGTLGFGLSHLYPVTLDTELHELAMYLKGEDAHVYRACRELQLRPLLQIIYQHDSDDWGAMSDRIEKDLPKCYSDEYRFEESLGGVAVNTTNEALMEDEVEVEDSESDEEECCGGEFITWVSPFNQRNQLDGPFVTGNEAYLESSYCSPCIIVRIPASADRL